MENYILITVSDEKEDNSISFRLNNTEFEDFRKGTILKALTDECLIVKFERA